MIHRRANSLCPREPHPGPCLCPRERHPDSSLDPRERHPAASLDRGNAILVRAGAGGGPRLATP